MSDSVPNFLVAGAGRSGTTGLVEGLRTHPDVFVTNPKEPHFFALHGRGAHFTGPGDDATINRVAVTERARYLGLYPPPGRYQALGDGSVSTLYYFERSVPAILDMNPGMRIVVILRDPVDRAYSSYQYMRARGFEPASTFCEALDQEQERRRRGWHHLWHYTAMSRYADSVEAFLSAFGRDQVTVRFYDDLVSDYESTVSDVLRFLALPVREREGAGVPRVNISGEPRWRLAQQVVWAATRNDVVRRAVKRTTSYRLREWVRRRALQRTEVDEEARTQLTSMFADDLRRLSKLLGATPQPAWLRQDGEA